MDGKKFECYAKYLVYAIVILLLLIALFNGCNNPEPSTVVTYKDSSNAVTVDTAPKMNVWTVNVTDSLLDTVYVGEMVTDSVLGGRRPKFTNKDTTVPYHYHYYTDDYHIHYIVTGKQVVNSSELEDLENKQ